MDGHYLAEIKVDGLVSDPTELGKLLICRSLLLPLAAF